MIEDRVGIWKKCMTAQKSGEQRWTGTGGLDWRLDNGWMDGWMGGGAEDWDGDYGTWMDGWMNGVAEQMKAVSG